MDRRNLAPTIRTLVISLIVVGCTLTPGDVESETPIGDAQSVPTTSIPDPAAISVVAPEPHPFAGIDLTRHRLHWYVPQPE